MNDECLVNSYCHFPKKSFHGSIFLHHKSIQTIEINSTHSNLIPFYHYYTYYNFCLSLSLFVYSSWNRILNRLIDSGNNTRTLLKRSNKFRQNIRLCLSNRNLIKWAGFKYHTWMAVIMDHPLVMPVSITQLWIQSN